jgi:hypothetical protein
MITPSSYSKTYQASEVQIIPKISLSQSVSYSVHSHFKKGMRNKQVFHSQMSFGMTVLQVLLLLQYCSVTIQW